MAAPTRERIGPQGRGDLPQDFHHGGEPTRPQHEKFGKLVRRKLNEKLDEVTSGGWTSPDRKRRRRTRAVVYGTGIGLLALATIFAVGPENLLPPAGPDSGTVPHPSPGIEPVPPTP